MLITMGAFNRSPIVGRSPHAKIGSAKPKGQLPFTPVTWLGIFINGGTPMWMVYNGKSDIEMDDLGVPLF